MIKIKKQYLLIFTALLLISLSMNEAEETSSKKLKKIIEFYYLPNEYLSINIFEFFYNNNQIDSVIYNTRNEADKFTLRYKNNKNVTEVFSYLIKKDTIFKLYEYELDTSGRLSLFKKFEKNKIITKDSFVYKSSVLKKKLSTHFFLWFDSANYFEENYFVNSSGNIDSSYLYRLKNDTSKILLSKSHFKYDDKINPFQNLLFQKIENNYFNSNNMLDEYIINTTVKFKDSALFKFEYDENNYPIRRRYRKYHKQFEAKTYKYVYK